MIGFVLRLTGQRTEARMEEIQANQVESVPGRTWTTRCKAGIKYQRYSGTDCGGRSRIFFKFDATNDNNLRLSKVSETLAKFKEFKGLGTGFKLTKDRMHGWVWTLPNSHLGRHIADLVDEAMQELADKPDNVPSR
jgi:hypothetical protein